MAVLKEADDGSMAAPMQLFEEMEEKDPHLFSVASTRRLALTGLDWQVVSAAEVREGVDATSAAETAEYCGQILADLAAFDDVLQHLAMALGRNIAVAEIVWDVAGGELRPVDLVPVDFTRLVFDELDRPHVLTGDNDRDGIELTANKFIVHVPHGASGHPQRGGLMRVTAMTYLAKNLALKDWMIFAEVFGMPVRIARYEPTATAEEKRELLHMLESLGSNAAGIFSRAVELQIIESKKASSSAPYNALIEFLNREMSKAWLGQTLTTDIAGLSGSVSASRVHETVRQDILADDIRKEGRTMRRDLLAPITRLRFGPDAPVPFFRRMLKTPREVGDVVRVLDAAVNDLGMAVPDAWARETLGVPEAIPGEPTLRRTRT
jgi:phage gp29-like protein